MKGSSEYACSNVYSREYSPVPDCQHRPNARPPNLASATFAVSVSILIRVPFRLRRGLERMLIALAKESHNYRRKVWLGGLRKVGLVLLAMILVWSGIPELAVADFSNPIVEFAVHCSFMGVRNKDKVLFPTELITLQTSVDTVTILNHDALSTFNCWDICT